MPQRFFIGNFDFEHRLSDPNYSAPFRLQRLNAELATAWLAVAADGDFVWTPEPIDAQFFRDAVSAGLPAVVPVTSFDQVPRDVECVPWGWSLEIRGLVDRFGWTENAPAAATVKAANSRATSFELEQRWKVGLAGSERIESFDQIEAAIRSLNGGHRWVIKAEFGMSARERIFGCGVLNVADQNWVRRRLANHGVLFFEPWVERIGEVGIQIDVPALGALPRLVGLTPMLVDHRGQYAGSWCAFDEQQFPLEHDFWPKAIDVCLQAAMQIQAAGYSGPLGIDTMVYRDDDGSMRVRPLQDMNARWTMGRLALGFRRLLKPGQIALWEHGGEVGVLNPGQLSHVIPTTPQLVGGMACRRSQLRVWSP